MNVSAKDNAIFCDNLSKEFFLVDDQLNWRIVFKDKNQKLKSFKALTDVNLAVPKGKFIGILGRNGAGKSTLLRVLGGVYPPSAGIVNVTGAISGLFEMGEFSNRSLSGHSYADRYLEIYGVPKHDRPHLINNIKIFSELGNAFHKPIFTYSTGMCARLFFSTATEMQHEIYLVDELLSVGDEHFQSKCWKRLRERFTNGSSGILVTHDWSAVLKLCEYSYILDKGKIVSSGSSEDIVREYLNLPIPSNEYAEIITPQHTYVFESGKDSNIDFIIRLKTPIQLALNYSVELFRPGFGWELILLNEDFISISTNEGDNPYRISIKKLPLVKGEYYLNVFLKSLDENIDANKIESRSWTYGNGMKLKVIGEDTDALTALPWKIHQMAVPNE